METKKILLVDDDPDFLEQTSMLIENMGFEVVKAYGQKEAEEILEELKPDLCIFDVMMENEDSGIILSYKVKKKYPDLPVILLTAMGHESNVHFDMEEGAEAKWVKADKILEKGVRPDQLKREIFKLLKI